MFEGPAGKQHIETDGGIVGGRLRPEATLLADPMARDTASGGPICRCSDPTCYAVGNMLRPVESAGWCWADERAVGRAILMPHLPPSTGLAISGFLMNGRRSTSLCASPPFRAAWSSCLRLPALLHRIGIGRREAHGLASVSTPPAST